MTTFRSEAETRSPRGRAGWVGRSLLAVLALLVLAVGARVLIVRSFDSGPQPLTLAHGDKVAVRLLDGRRSTLADLARPGIPTVISVWASWCGPCRKEAPVLVSLRERFGRDQLNLLYLNAREPDASPDELRQFAKEVGIDPREVAVLDDTALRTLTNDSINLIPRTYIFDRVGAPVAMIVGYKPLALARVAGLLE